MPRSKSDQQQRRQALGAEPDLVCVHVLNSLVKLTDVDLSRTAAWLVGKVKDSYDTSQDPKNFRIERLRTSKGIVLANDDVLRDVLQKGDSLMAEGAFLSENALQEDSGPAPEAVQEFTTGRHSEAYGHNARVFDISFAPFSSNIFATAADDGIAKVWSCSDEVAQCRQIASFHGHTDSIMCVSWSVDSRLVATGSADTSVHVWQPGVTGCSEDRELAGYAVSQVAHLEGHPEEVYAAKFLQGNSTKRLLTASTWLPFIWDLETCEQLAMGPPIPAVEQSDTRGLPERWQAGHIFHAEQTPEGGPFVAAACSDGCLRLWTLTPGFDSLEAHSVSQKYGPGMGSSCAWHPNGQQVALLSTDGTLALLDVRMGNRACWLAHTGRPLFSCCFLPCHAHTIAVCGQGSSITLLDVSSAAPPERLTGSKSGQESSQFAAIDPDKGPHGQLLSRSKTMADRNLLCVGVSRDGQALAASGDSVLLNPVQDLWDTFQWQRTSR